MPKNNNYVKKAQSSDKLVMRDTARLDKSVTKFVSKLGGLDQKIQALEAESQYAQTWTATRGMPTSYPSLESSFLGYVYFRLPRQ